MNRRIVKKIASAAMCGCLLLLCSCGGQETEDVSASLTAAPIGENLVEENPYMAEGESIIHNDVYSSDVTSCIVPLGIYPEITSAKETEGDKASPCFFYDSDGNCITPYSLKTEKGVISGGVAIRDVNSDPVKTLGSFLPVRDDGQPYGIQISYAFVDNNGFVTGAATNGHILMLRTKDENGEILEKFEKAVDIDVLTVAQNRLGDDIDPNLMSVIMDYDGNLWFTTGGFRINPEYAEDGFIGYVDREYIDAAIGGGTLDAGKYIHVYRLGEGEGAENGISSHPKGCVILTNKACYLLNASEEGVKVEWRTPYESEGGSTECADPDITGAGLAWGSGTTPTLTRDLVLYTDNMNPVNLTALDVSTGEVVAECPVFEGMEDVTISVENSILVYSSDPEQVSTLVCNWYGAGNKGLYEADADSSEQSYDNLYDKNWISEGSECLQPGMERIDTVKDGDRYTMKSVWQRDDLCATAMFKLSTATGYLYGYTEIGGVWQYLVLDWDTGETVLSVPVSDLSKYNNMAVGMMQGINGNALYVPTNNLELLCLRDRFAYLPEKPYAELDIKKMEREICSAERLSDAGENLQAATWIHSAEAENIGEPTVMAFRVNGLSGSGGDYRLLAETADGALKEYSSGWSLTREDGTEIGADEKLSPEQIYEIRITVTDGSEYDLNSGESEVKAAVMLAAEK